jgi:hypothetical protein
MDLFQKIGVDVTVLILHSLYQSDGRVSLFLKVNRMFHSFVESLEEAISLSCVSKWWNSLLKGSIADISLWKVGSFPILDDNIIMKKLACDNWYFSDLPPKFQTWRACVAVFSKGLQVFIR